MGAADRYCAACGQKAIGREDLNEFLQQFLGDYFTWDSKLIRSLVPLLVRPGFLTTEYLAGRRARYIPPLRMFIFLSIIFFLVIGWSTPRTGDATLAEAIEDRVFWDHFFASVLPKLFFLFLPLFALITHLLHRRTADSFVRTFILSTHFHAFVFLAFALYGALSGMLSSLGLVRVNTLLVLAVLAYAGIYLWLALRRVYPRRWPGQLARFIALAAMYVLVLAGSAVLVAWALL